MKKYRIVVDYLDQLLKDSKPGFPAFNESERKRYPNNKWDYNSGVMIYGLTVMYRETNDQKYFEFLKSWIDWYISPTGVIKGLNIHHYSTDDISQSRVLFDMYEWTKEERFLTALHTSYEQIKGSPRTKEGNFWHKKVYHDQVWLDGLYMLQPLYARYETHFNNGKNYSDIINQFENVRRLMFDEGKKLYYHGYDESKSMFWADPVTGWSKCFWGRAIGWLLAAMVDVAYFMDSDKNKAYLGTLLKEAIDGLLIYQDSETKMFWQVVDQANREGNYIETSVSTLTAYACLKGANLGILPDKYFKIGLEIFEGVIKHRLIKRDGKLVLTGINEVSGLGPEDNERRDGTYEYYVSEAIIEDDSKASGSLVLAYAEILKAHKKGNPDVS